MGGFYLLRRSILKEIRKDATPSRIQKAFRAARAAGMSTRGYFMIGSRSESRETIGETEALIDDIRPDRLAFSIMTPYPGCEEYDLWKQVNGHANIDWSEIDLLDRYPDYYQVEDFHFGQDFIHVGP